MIEFVRAKKRLLWAFVLLLVWTCGYRYAADKAEAEQTALIATYRHSSMVAAEQYALQLKKAQDERQRWYDFSQKQGRKPVKKQYPPQTKKAGYLKTKEELLAELACPKKARCLNPWERSAAERTQLVAGLRQCHPLNCCWGLSFYYQLAVQSAEDKYADLKRHIHDIYRRHKGRYGYRRIAAAIRHAGTPVNHKKVSRLMAKTGLKAVIRRRKYRSFKGEVGKIAPNILRRCFHAEKPNEKWVTDVTEFNVGGEKIYLSPIMDLFNGEIVSYRIQIRPTFDLAGEILKGAPEKPGSSEKPILHSDQGWQYQMFFYSGLNLNQDKAMKPQTVQIVRQGEATPYWFKFNPLYNNDRIKLKLKGLSLVQYRIQSLKAA
ncbi:TPA: IS3 family transposase [Neisseria meningitidis]